MKFVIATQELNFLINKCLNIVAQRTPTIPILSNLLIEAANDELVVTATDLTVGIRCVTEAKILEEGATTLPAKRVSQLLRELTALNLEVTCNANEITEIIADSSHFKLHGMNKSEFPSLPNMADATQILIKQSELKDALFRTSFAVSRDDNRYVLTGVCMHIANGEATFIGTDGKRLARARMPLQLDQAFSCTSIIPIKAVEEIVKNLSDEGEATLSLLPDKIAIDASHTTVITKLLSGEYPDINRVIPERSEAIVALHREELMTLLRQVSLFSEVSHSVRFAFTEGELKLTANTSEIGEGNVSMPVNYRGPRIEIAFNPNFFLDILRHAKAETVTIGMTDPYNPGIITDSATSGVLTTSPSLFVLMPMRLNEA